MSEAALNTVTINYYDEAEKYYVSHYFLSSACCKSYDDYTECHPVPLKVTLLLVKKEVRTFGNARSPATVFKLVVMDGSQYIFLIVLNTGLARQFVGLDLIPGATLTLSKYTWICLAPPNIKHGTLSRAYCFVDKINVNDGPGKKWTSDDETAITIEYMSVIIDEEVIDYVVNTSSVVFTYPVSQDKDGEYIIGFMSNGDIKRAIFIACPEMRKKFLFREKQKRSRELTTSTRDDTGQVVCGCSDFGLMDCVLQSYPIEDLDEDDLFDQIEYRLGERVTATSFGSLKESHQRWAFYWWYAVNIFNVKGSRRKQLPECFVECVRVAFPNKPTVDYTGFKEKSVG